MSLAWWQSVRDRKRENPLQLILNREIYQHQIMTRIWKYMTECHAPHVTPYNIGHIVYSHTLHNHIYHVTNMCFDYLRDSRHCCDPDQRHCNPDRRRRWVESRSSTIFIKLRCGCLWEIGNRFYNVLKNMKLNAIRLTNHVNICQNMHPR